MRVEINLEAAQVLIGGSDCGKELSNGSLRLGSQKFDVTLRGSNYVKLP
jgi:hypothetical protein